ncbi:MAG: pseudouridine synthase [Paracoccaceae bacterium]
MSRPRPRPRRPAGPPRLVAFNKPMDMLSQFTDDGHWPGLGRLLDMPGMYPAGRLDRDSEGLLLLTNDGRLQARLTDPAAQTPKTYFALVEGVPDASALQDLRAGVTLKDGPTRPALVDRVAAPDWLWPRDPPVRFRKSVPEAWLRLTITEGRNRQVRRMCAHVGLPVLRLVRWSVGDHTVEGLAPGEWRALPV